MPQNSLSSNLVGEFLDNGRKFRLTEPFKFENIVVPTGFVTDFNSVPRGLWNVFPPWQYPEAGVVHDWLYHFPGGWSRGDCDRAHSRVLEAGGCPWLKRKLVYGALRAGGWGAWKQHRKEDPK